MNNDSIKEMGKKFKKETIASKAGIGKDIQHGAIVPPLYLGTNFEYEEIGKEPPYEYSRQGNPNKRSLNPSFIRP